MYGRSIDDDRLRSAFRSSVLVVLTGAVKIGLQQGRTRSKCLTGMHDVWRLAELDGGGTGPTQANTLDVCDRVGLLEDRIDNMDLGVVDQMMQAKQPLDMTIEKVTSSRRPFLLDEGELGLGNEDAEPGDQLFIVADGGRVCLLFRAFDSASSKWRLMGEAYVREMLHEDAVDEMEKSRKQ